MKKITILFFVLFTTLSSCTSDKETTDDIKNENTFLDKYKNQSKLKLKETTDTKKIDTNSKKVTSSKIDSSKKRAEQERKLGMAQKTVIRPQQKLLQSIPKGVKIEFAAPDFSLLEDDTLIVAKSGRFEIKYLTQSLNDSLVAQAMYDYSGTNAKSYLISHNYRTSISMKKNGKLVGAKAVEKELFKGKVDPDFLEKSIIKHPEFVRFDEEKNEAIFKFMMGVPNTDWLVFAAINLNDQGKLRIIEILIPEL